MAKSCARETLNSGTLTNRAACLLLRMHLRFSPEILSEEHATTTQRRGGVFGLFSSEEICVAFLFYYPRQIIAIQGHQVPFSCGFDNIFPFCAVTHTTADLSDLSQVGRTFGIAPASCLLSSAKEDAPGPSLNDGTTSAPSPSPNDGTTSAPSPSPNDGITSAPASSAKGRASFWYFVLAVLAAVASAK